MSNEEDPLRKGIERLVAQNRALEEQLQFARQKASLYYITASELDALKRGNISFVETVSVGTSTDAQACGFSASTQTTEVGSADIEIRSKLELAQTESKSLTSYIDSLQHTESLKNRLDRLLIQSSPDFVLDEYINLLQEVVKQNKLSVNHSIQIKRRDEMISSLIEKIRMIEEAFSKKLSDTQRLADTRQAVIQALGEQVKEAVVTGSSDWALVAEMEDLKAELSMARTNWAATREELVRLQFRDGGDGNHLKFKFPNPVIEILDRITRESGMISEYRSISSISP